MPTMSRFRFASVVFSVVLTHISLLPAITLVNDGAPASVLVVPDENRLVPFYAAKEFQYHVRKATGADLPILPESRAEGVAGGKVYFGLTQALERAGLGREEFGKYGYAGRLKDGSLFFYGRDSGLPAPADVSENDLLLMRAAPMCWKKPIGTYLAVNDFLDTELGARWIWPGPTGEFVPKRKSISVEKYDNEGAPRYLSNWMLLYDEESPFLRQWMLRHRFLRLEPVVTVHSYTNYWRDYQDKYPEIFSLLPNGRRELLPGAPADHATMCVSSTKLLDLKIERWKNRADPFDGAIDEGFINVYENDIDGRCVCASCRAWDAPDPRFETHEYYARGVIRGFREGGRFFREEGPSLTDRYMKFALLVQQQADKIKPGVIVRDHIGYQQFEPPEQTKLNERVLMTYVGAPGQFWTDERDREFRENWSGWRAAGPSMFFRPNTLHRGHNLPDIYTTRIGEALKFIATNGLVGTEWDALIGNWAVQAPNYYMIGRMLRDPGKSPEEIMDEFCSAFGAAKPEMGAYFKYWEALISSLDAGKEQDFLEDVKKDNLGHAHPLMLLGYAMTPEVMARGRALLEMAKPKAAGDPEVAARLEIVDLGLQNAELTLGVMRAFRELGPLDSAGQQKFMNAADALERFRAQYKGRYLSDSDDHISQQENAIWGNALKTLRARQTPAAPADPS